MKKLFIALGLIVGMGAGWFLFINKPVKKKITQVHKGQAISKNLPTGMNKIASEKEYLRNKLDCLSKDNCKSEVKALHSYTQKDYFEVGRALEQSLEDNTHDEISKTNLFKLIETENKHVLIPAIQILYTQGKEAVLAGKETFKKMNTRFVTKFIHNISKSHLISDPDIREFRNELVNDLLLSGRPLVLRGLQKVIPHIRFDQQEKEKIKDNFCSLELNPNSEAAGMVAKGFNTYFKEHLENPDC